MNQKDFNMLDKVIGRVPDFPKKGILFYDITGILRHPEEFKYTIDRMCEIYGDKKIDAVAGIESRGFIFASCFAERMGIPLILIRKKGKLPCETVQESYAKEYGIDTIEIHKDAITEDDIVLLHDDLLATGGTMKAACDLVRKFNPKKVYCNFIIELHEEFPNSREIFDKDIEITSLLKF